MESGKSCECMKRMFIHIGYPKTGTTSIQQFLYDNPSLLEENNLYYPQQGISKPALNHSNLPRSFEWNTRANHLYKKEDGSFPELVKEISNINQNIILSSEGFMNALSADANKTNDAIKSFFNQYAISYLLVLRKSDDFIESSFTQRLKAWSVGRLKGRLKTIKSLKKKHIGVGHHNYLNVFEEILKLPEDKWIIKYSRDVVNDLFSVISGKDHEVESPNTNITFSHELLTLLYFISTGPKAREYQAVFIKNRKKIIRIFAEEEEQPEALTANTSDEKSVEKVPVKYGIFSMKERKALHETFLKQMAKYQEDYQLNLDFSNEKLSEKKFFIAKSFSRRQNKLIKSLFNINLNKRAATFYKTNKKIVY